YIFFFQAEDGIRDGHVTGVQTCALPICISTAARGSPAPAGGSARLPAPALRRGSTAPCCRRGSPIPRATRRHRGSPRRSAFRGRSEERRVGKESTGRWEQGDGRRWMGGG